MKTLFPYIVEAADLAAAVAQETFQQENGILIDLCKSSLYSQSHIPGAVYLDYTKIVATRPPVMGLLPDKQQLQALLGELGISPDTHVVTYDDEGGGKAARFLWTLAAIGHQKMSLLNGGIHAWANERFPLETEANLPQLSVSTYTIEFQDNVIATKEYIMEQLDNPACIFMDARSDAEYSGKKKFAERAGHIPGAINVDWSLLIDQNNSLRLKDNETLRNILQSAGINEQHEVIVYCQTHHRSALSFVALTQLGFDKVKGYPGSWSDWGNSPSTPIE
ncbi:MAG: sulfurtransferase [Thiohalomonadales bacterium]